MTARWSAQRGFSLLEVLLVAALVVVLLGTATLGLPRDGTASALRSAEAELSSLLAQARSGAIRWQGAVRLGVQLDVWDQAEIAPQHIVILRVDAGGDWRPEVVHRLAPEVAVLPGAPRPAPGVTWPSAGTSAFQGQQAIAGFGAASGNYGYIQFSATGAVFGSPQLVLSAVRRGESGPVAFAPERARRFLLRATGAFAVRHLPGS